MGYALLVHYYRNHSDGLTVGQCLRLITECLLFKYYPSMFRKGERYVSFSIHKPEEGHIHCDFHHSHDGRVFRGLRASPS